MDEKKLRKYAGLPLVESVEKIDEAVGTAKDLIESVQFLAGITKSSSERGLAIDLLKREFRPREISSAVTTLEILIELLADELGENKEEKIDESVTVGFTDPKDGPNITVSVGDIMSQTLDRREAGFSSFRITHDARDRLPTAEDSPTAFSRRNAELKKQADKKLKELQKLSKKFQVDVKKVLEK